MLSWRLWQILQRPSYKNPIFRRVRKQPTRTIPQISLSGLHLPPRLVNVILILALILVLQQPHLLFEVLKVLIVLLMLVICSPLLLPLAVIVYGIYLSLTISSEISAEKEASTYDLLCISPDGSLSVSWRFASGILHRSESFMWLKTAITLILGLVGVVFFVIMGLVTFMSMTEGGFTDLWQPIRMVLDVVLFLCLIYTGYSQSIVLSIIIGLLMPALDFYRRDVMMVAVFSYILLEILPYIVLVACINVYNLIFYGHYAGLDLLLDVSLFVIVYGIRELIIALLWHRLIHRLNASPDFIYPMTQIA